MNFVLVADISGQAWFLLAKKRAVIDLELLDRDATDASSYSRS